MANTVLHYSLATNFPNGVRLDYLQQQFLQSVLIFSMCTSIMESGDDIACYFNGVLGSEEIAAADDIVANYENPPENKVLFQTNNPAPDAIKFNAYGDEGGVTFTSKAGGHNFLSTGQGRFESNQNVFRSPNGNFFSMQEGFLEDQDFTLSAGDIFRQLLVISPSAQRTLTMPDVADFLAGCLDPKADDTISLFIKNISPDFSVVLAEGAGCTFYESITVAPSSTVNLRIRIAATGSDISEPAVYTVYRVN